MNGAFFDSSVNSSIIISYNLLENCEIMADYIIKSGMKMPEKIGDSLSKIALKAAPFKIEMYKQSEKQTQTAFNSSMNKLFQQDEFIPKNIELEYKMKIGLAINEDVPELQKIYTILSAIVAPATPHSIECTNPTKKLFFYWGPKYAPIIRNMALLTVVFLIGFIITQIQSSLVGVPTIWDKYRGQLNLIFASGVGAFFYSIYIANKYIVRRTFEAKYVGLYSVRITLGIIVGFIVANVVNPGRTLGQSGDFASLIPVILALLGGFSADAVMKIMTRVVAMFTTLVEGDTQDIIQNKLAGQKAKLQEKIIRQKISNVNELIPVISELQGKADEDTIQKLTEIVNRMLEQETLAMQDA